MPRAISTPTGRQRPRSPQPHQAHGRSHPPSHPAAQAHRDQIGAPLHMSQHCRAPTLAGHLLQHRLLCLAPQMHSRDEPQDRKGLPHSEPLSSEPWGASAIRVGRSRLCHVPGTAQPCDSGVWEMQGVKVQPSGSLRTVGGQVAQDSSWTHWCAKAV